LLIKLAPASPVYGISSLFLFPKGYTHNSDNTRTHTTPNDKNSQQNVYKWNGGAI